MKNLLKILLNNNNHALAPFILRLVLGIIFIGHGWGKLFGEGNPDGFAGWLASMGLEPSYLLAVAAGLSETLGGALLIVGLLTRAAAGSLVIVMLVAISFVHLDAGMFGKGGYEFQLLLMAGVMSLLIQGPGKYSLDEVINKKL
ncbi:DoxX family protein [Pseudoalteromonas denitrificans]|uniref:Putative oxidoreductase n=1 Tax=Pseudoalteromonas denitrificans DSM 6059 TaxID=1123010 RepID=A0A1I1N931_9GAMM|nr:DoxX family protein [Pseudoalteromonas denitrificans]SFC90250.1 putative oxidoreductase [Pseudoalteromonas denitrificans DSM 6059]